MKINSSVRPSTNDAPAAGLFHITKKVTKYPQVFAYNTLVQYFEFIIYELIHSQSFNAPGSIQSRH